MKSVIKYSLLTLVVLQWVACEEVLPDIDFECETERKVIVEEFTGVKCAQCPTGSEKLEQLSNEYGDQIIPISIHTGFFSVPFSDSPEDFTIDDGDAIDALLGPVTGWPKAVVDRKLFSGESSRILGTNSWAGRVQEELCEEPLVSVDIDLVYDATSRNVEITVAGASIDESRFSTPLGLVVLITESNIIAPQATLETSKDPNYVHKYVLRNVITDIEGEEIHNGDGSVLSIYTKTYNYTLPAHWVAEECDVVAFVTYQGNDSYDVLQADKVSVL